MIMVFVLFRQNKCSKVKLWTLILFVPLSNHSKLGWPDFGNSMYNLCFEMHIISRNNILERKRSTHICTHDLFVLCCQNSILTTFLISFKAAPILALVEMTILK